MKLTIINSLYHPHRVGGAELSVQSIAEGLVRCGTQVTVLTLAGAFEPGISEFNGVEIVRLPLSNLYWPFNTHRPKPWKRLLWHAIDTVNPVPVTQVTSELRRRRPDVLQTHNLAGFGPQVWLAAKSLGIPIVHTIHDYYLLCPKSTMFKQSRSCTRQCLGCKAVRTPHRMLSKLVASVVGVSSFVLNRHLQAGLFPNAVSKVIYNGFDLDTAANTTTAPAREDGRTVIGYIGSISDAKGVSVLLDAVAGLNPKQFALEIAGVGKTDYQAELQTKFPLMNVKFLGKVPVNQFLPGIDVLVVPSVWAEPFGRVVVEAYLFGKPVVASHSGGISELVEDGVTGFLVKPGDAEALRSALNRFAPGTPRTLADPAALRQITQRFGLQDLIQNYLQVQGKIVPVRPEPVRSSTIHDNDADDANAMVTRSSGP
jgi:glycosyltransferase involved in cell wall biosynthesis